MGVIKEPRNRPIAEFATDPLQLEKLRTERVTYRKIIEDKETVRAQQTDEYHQRTLSCHSE